MQNDEGRTDRFAGGVYCIFLRHIEEVGQSAGWFYFHVARELIVDEFSEWYTRIFEEELELTRRVDPGALHRLRMHWEHIAIGDLRDYMVEKGGQWRGEYEHRVIAGILTQAALRQAFFKSPPPVADLLSDYEFHVEIPDETDVARKERWLRRLWDLGEWGWAIMGQDLEAVADKLAELGQQLFHALRNRVSQDRRR